MSCDDVLLLAVPSGPLELTFGPGHDALAAETRELWSHLLLDPADPPAETWRCRIEAPATGDTTGPFTPTRATDAGTAAGGADAGTLTCTTDADTPAGVASAGAPKGTPGTDVLLITSISPGPGAAYALSGYLTRQILRRMIGTRILLHAGVVDHPDLGVVLLVGPSGAGKSTATTVLGRSAGVGYLSDELGIIDPQSLKVEAYPKPVSRVSGDVGISRKRDLPLAGEGLTPVPSAAAPDHVLLLNRVGAADAPAPSLCRVPMAEALPTLIAQSSSMWKVPGALGVLAGLLNRAGGALEVTYSDADQIAGLLAYPPAAAHEDWVPVESVGTEPQPVRAGGYRCAPFHDALGLSDSLVILGQRSVRVIAGIGALVWELLHESGGATASELEQQLIAEMGDHPDSAAIAQQTLDELVRIGAVERSDA